jgi:hypothetical protein
MLFEFLSKIMYVHTNVMYFRGLSSCSKKGQNKRKSCPHRLFSNQATLLDVKAVVNEIMTLN